MKLWQCTCGQVFYSKHKLTNHIGYAILRDDNKDQHADISENNAASSDHKLVIGH